MESVKQTGLSKGKFDSSAIRTLSRSLDNKRADNSSSLGIVTPRTGVTHVFAAISFTSTLSSSSNLTYTTAAYALAEASQNPSSLTALGKMVQ